jgi:hypothetical protein
MRGKKAKAIRKFLGKPLPRVRCVEDGTTRQINVGGQLVEVKNYVPQELTEEEKQTKSEYRRLKQMYKNGELPL